MRRRGTRALAPLSLLGRLELKRGYWTCGCAKGGGVHPLDRALGIAGRAGARLTPAALRAVAEEAAEKSFAKAAESLGRLCGVEVTAKRAERAAKQVGREIAAWDESAPALAEAPAETMYRSADGTGVPMVRRDAGTGDDGQPTKTREAKVAVFHTAERNPKTGLPERAAGSARHTAAIDSARSRDADSKPSPFARRLWQAARRVRVRGGEAAGADRGRCEVDLEHRRGTVPERHPHCRHLACLAAAVGGRARRARRRRAALPGVVGKGLRGALRGTRVGDVLRELRRHAGEPVADQAVGYFENNRGRMRYPLHLAMGLLIGSGVVESSCGTLVAARFKRGGMHWSKAGANDILPLRACIRSGRYDDFWRQRRGPPTPAVERLAH